MGRCRVFRTKVECPRIAIDVRIAANREALAGKTVTLDKADTDVNLCLAGTVIGQLEPEIGRQVLAALDRKQAFNASIEKAYPIYDAKFKLIGASLRLRVEYVLEKGQPVIEVPKQAFLLPEIDIASTSFYTTVAGVTHEGRQRIVARCSIGEMLSLVRDQNNEFDAGAIKVMRLNGQQLGFLPQHVSRDGDPGGLAARMDRGIKYACRIKDLTGGDAKTRGVNIEITECKDDASVLPPAVLSSSDASRSQPGRGCSILGIAAIMMTLLLLIRFAG